MDKNDLIINNYLEPKMMQSFSNLLNMYFYFVNKTGENMEIYKYEYNKLGEIPYEKITPEIISAFYNSSIEICEKTLVLYNNLISSFETTIGNISSKFSMREFLSKNDISFDKIYEFQKIYDEAWENSYGEIFLKLKEISKILLKLRDLLIIQIEKFKKIGNEKLYDAIKENLELFDLFKQEYGVFWNEITPSLTKDVYNLEEKLTENYKNYFIRLKSYVKAQKKIISQEVKEDFSNKNNIQKTILILVYISGAIIVVSSLKSKIFYTGLDKIKKSLIKLFKKKEEKNKTKLREQLEESLKETITGEIEETVLDNIENLLNEV